MNHVCDEQEKRFFALLAANGIESKFLKDEIQQPMTISFEFPQGQMFVVSADIDERNWLHIKEKK